jgi:hypothetical protein
MRIRCIGAGEVQVLGKHIQGEASVAAQDEDAHPPRAAAASS